MKVFVVAAIITKGSKILITQRKADCKREPNKWEFPGGKLEKGETKEDGLKREIKEELDIEIEVKELFGESVKIYPNGDEVVVSAYFAKIKKGKPKTIECQKIKWVTKNELQNFDFADADLALVNLFLLENEE